MGIRNIIFRGKTKQGEWVYGYYLEEYRKDRTKKSCIFGSWTDGEKVFNHKEMVIPETVGQFTGLTDKNGKKIFEGDFLKTDINSRLYRVYLDECNRIQIQDFYGCAIKPKQDAINYFKAVVVGNEIDNPELMEKWREQDE